MAFKLDPHDMAQIPRRKINNSFDLKADLTGPTFTGPVVLMTYAKAALPAATTAALIYVTDDVGGATIAFGDGTNYLRVQDRAIIA